MNLLGSRKDAVEKERAREKGRLDFSDVVRRVGVGDGNGKNGSGSLRGGFEIYVDPTNDPDIGGMGFLLVLVFVIL